MKQLSAIELIGQLAGIKEQLESLGEDDLWRLSDAAGSIDREARRIGV